MSDPLKDHFVRTVPRGSELPERDVYLGDGTQMETNDPTARNRSYMGGISATLRDAAKSRRETIVGELMVDAAARLDQYQALLSALIHQIELGDYTDKHGHKLTDNVCFIKAKEAVGE
jgi:hypothetical protein